MKKSKNIAHIQSCENQGRVMDASSKQWVYNFLPSSLWFYAQLARWDRPIGWKLLMWPCFWSTTMAFLSCEMFQLSLLSMLINWLWYLTLFFIGSIAMRGAGCTWNDLIDHKIDSQVERTRSRPLPTGHVSRFQAKVFLFVQCLVGLGVLSQFNRFSFFLGISSLVAVAIYPFMKRVTYWPQFFLGIAFNWGALMGWAVVYGSLGWAPVFIYIGSILWTMGYDTIYAHQDKEDDVTVGVLSTALLFGKGTKRALVFLYSGFIVFVSLAFYLAQVPLLSFLGLFVASIHVFMQIKIINIDDSAQCLKLFKSNSFVGFLIFVGLVCGGIWKVFYPMI
ncbi:4-hydroxybenzoate octaprenyltransferase [Bartonella doshiae]|uniref:4-hydroxybenzoate octaprenyltransferase n=2 Tax=Bartonella doshiae TaxID=33044 RepID=A0A380ZD07_BARDO|nr:4-hydroxybenzoate octaprenyltransferase [Bartonella doshiae]EJF82013.1 4-hydroxybenzoate polyprenyl transferase [Bartonella doshiae NCTC 12862 = ATCC 700133]MBB6159008.1 4-hydroxybenzoate polyprenyltransferase [Bartonella doshiae]SUV44561.1 4-hydroxybenzoate octaprenyltransferase [Bartonella doshiae]